MTCSSDEEKLHFKQGLKALCQARLHERVTEARDAMNAAQQSANSEEKSSAGDKYETSRAMNQIDRDRNAKRLDEALQELLLMESMITDRIYHQANNGAVIKCAANTYFILCGLGMVDFAADKIAVLSPKSPFANAIRDKKAGEKVNFNGNDFYISEVF